MSMPSPYTDINQCDNCCGDGWEPEIVHQHQPMQIVNKRMPYLFDLGKCNSCNGTGKQKNINHE